MTQILEQVYKYYEIMFVWVLYEANTTMNLDEEGII